MYPLVAACGKFQPFHKEHLEFVCRSFDVGKRVIIGITNPDPTHTRLDSADPKRGLPETNIWTYYERYQMVRECLSDIQISPRLFDIVPFPLNVPEIWFDYIPREAVFVLTLYDDDPWLQIRKNKLESAGVTTHVLWSKKNKGVTGTAIRSFIRQGHPWKHLVPEGTARVIEKTIAAGLVK